MPTDSEDGSVGLSDYDTDAMRLLLEIDGQVSAIRLAVHDIVRRVDAFERALGTVAAQADRNPLLRVIAGPLANLRNGSVSAQN
jgi:hypothetical protein